MSIKKLLILLIFPLFAFTTVHKYYVSVTQIDYVKEKKTIQITSRLFIDDFERLLQERYDDKIILDTGKDETQIDSYIEKYIRSKFVIKVNGAFVKYKFLGKEYENDIVYCYIEIENIEDVKSFEVENRILFDIFSDQKNVVRTFINSKHKTFVLIPENDKGLLNF
jgi:hypothetical protein